MIEKFKDRVKFNVEKRDVDGDDFPVCHITAQIGFGGDRYSTDSNEEIESSKVKLLEDLDKLFLKIGMTQSFIDLVFQAGYEQGKSDQEMDIPPMDTFLV